MKENREKLCYTAPKMEAVGFRTEDGYATSATTEKFTDVDITFGS